jgi:hypothetical protein
MPIVLKIRLCCVTDIGFSKIIWQNFNDPWIVGTAEVGQYRIIRKNRREF